MVDVAGDFFGAVRVFEIEVIVPGLDLIDGYAPGLLILTALLPPRPLGLELLNTNWFALVVALRTLWIGGPSAGLPRVYDLALQAISHGDAHVDPESLGRL
jgi:hypothetical protein